MKSDLLTAIKNAERLGEDGQLKQDRITALDEFLGEPYGNEQDGRSQVVDRTIANTINWLMPQLVKIFCSGDEICTFTPKGPEDIASAEQESDYVNYCLTQKNDWFSTFYAYSFDALTQKNGYIKAWWDTSESIEKEDYDALTDDEFAMLGQDEGAEIIAHESMLDENANQQREQAIMQLQQALPVAQPEQQQQIRQQLEQLLKTPKPMLHKVTVQRVNKYGQVRIKCLPPEQCIVSHNANDICLAESDFFEHWEMKTISQLRLEGFDVDDTIGDETETDDVNSQNRGNQSWWWKDDDEMADPSMRLVKVREVWIRFDENGDGKAELVHAIVVGSTFLEQEEVDLIPVAATTPQPMPHRHVGISARDNVEDLQFIKTMLVRGLLDNTYLANNGRYAVDANRVNIEDMMNSRPGGLVRTQGDPAGAIFPLVHQANFAPVMQALAYMDDASESRTGVTKYSQGLDASNLNKTATGIQQIMSASQERVMLVARVMANSVKELFFIVHSLIRKHQTKPDIVRLRNEWVSVDPRSWFKRSDMTISVGLGTGNNQEKLGQLGTMFQMQMAVAQAGMPIVQPQNLYETLSQMAKLAGWKQDNQFVTDPKQLPPAQPQPNPLVQVEQMKLQAKQQETQAKMQADAQKAQIEAQIEAQRLQMQAQLEQQKADAQLQQEQVRSQNDIAIKRDELAQQAELERYKAELKAQTDIKIAEMELHIKAAEMARQHEFDIHRAGMEQQRHEQTMAVMSKPKKVVRDGGGRVSGVE